MSSPRTNTVALLAGLVGGGALLYFFPPEQYHFYPVCPVSHYLHVLCPGCGATRAVAALVHGRFADAVRYNALVVTLLPFISAYFGAVAYRALRENRLSWPALPVPALRFALVLGGVFAVLRNLF